MSKPEDKDFVESICEELMKKYDPPQAIAILSSLITHIYAQHDQRSAYILAQPETNIAVVTTSLDSLDHLPEVLEKTFQSLQEATQEDYETTPKRPPNSKLH